MTLIASFLAVVVLCARFTVGSEAGTHVTPTSLELREGAMVEGYLRTGEVVHVVYTLPPDIETLVDTVDFVLEPCLGNPDLFVDLAPPTLTEYTMASINVRGDDVVSARACYGGFALPPVHRTCHVAIVAKGGGPAAFILRVKQSNVAASLYVEFKDIRVSETRASSVSVVWSPTLLMTNTSEPVRYEVRYGLKNSNLLSSSACSVQRLPEAAGAVTVNPHTRSLSAVISGLQVGSEYTVGVVAHCSGLTETYLLQTVHVEKLRPLSVWEEVQGTVSDGEMVYFDVSLPEVSYGHGSLSVSRPPAFSHILRLTVLSGDADLYVSVNGGIPSFHGADYNTYSAGDVEEMLLPPSVSRAIVGVYGYRASEWTLYVSREVSESSAQKVHARSTGSKSEPFALALWSFLKGLLSAIGQIILIVLEILA